MEGRGRKSSASLAVIAGGVETIVRQKPPAELTDEERTQWLNVVNAMPADWFTPETGPLLTQYCRHAVMARRIAQMIQAEVQGVDCDGNPIEFSLRDFNRLSQMQDRESRALSMLATKMRLSQQSTYDKSKKKGKQGPRPWES